MEKKVKKEKTKGQAVPGADKGRVVLVGTYRGDQLMKWRGWYNYPVGVGNGEWGTGNGRAALRRGRECTGGSSSSTTDFSMVNELWLFKGTKDERRYRATFVGIKTREELIRDYGSPGDDVSTQRHRGTEDDRGKRPACPRPHGTHYALFKIEFLYRHKGDVPEDAERVIIRTADFAKRSPKIAKQLKAYLESPDRRDPDLAKRLPSIITRLCPEQLRVCEAAVQLEFWDLPNMKVLKPAIPFPPPEHPKFTFIDLFAGVGGFRLAMQSIGGRCVFSSEWDSAAQDTYYRNYGEHPYGDITKNSTKAAIPRAFDVLCAGFPCQPFSLAGVSARVSLNKKHGFADKTQGTLFFDIIQVVRAHHPKVLFLENVRNLVNHDEGRTFKIIKEAIEQEGYSFNYRVIDASPLVPQKRLRCYMVCVKEGGAFEFPEITGNPLPLRSILERNVPEQFTISDGLWAGHQRRTKINLARGTGFTAFTANLDEPSHTLVARYYKDGKECLIPQEGRNPRLLTPRECARLQGFPENFVLPASRSVAYKQMGNSVAVPVLQRIAECINEQVLKGVNDGI